MSHRGLLRSVHKGDPDLKLVRLYWDGSSVSAGSDLGCHHWQNEKKWYHLIGLEWSKGRSQQKCPDAMSCVYSSTGPDRHRGLSMEREVESWRGGMQE